MHAIRESSHGLEIEATLELPAPLPAVPSRPRLALVERPGPMTERKALSLAPIERVRSTSATLRRIENMAATELPTEF